MQKDMHFFGVYALARAAGIRDKTALTMACASQFVDDATYDHVVHAEDHTILSIMTSHRMLDPQNANAGDQWRVWVPFHFLPGNEPEDGTFDQRMTCRPDSGPARTLKAFALRQDAGENNAHWPHLIGIAAHVYADTFSHFGFTGYSCDRNKAKEQTIRVTGEAAKNIVRFVGKLLKRAATMVVGRLAETVPVGHGPVGTFPDHPCISWKFEYEDGSGRQTADVSRDNHAHYVAACECLHTFFKDFAAANPAVREGTGKDWSEISPVVSGILKGKSGTDPDERIERWKKATRDGCFCSATKLDKEVDYDEKRWDLKECAKNHSAEIEEARCFMRAAAQHRDFVLQKLLPDLKLITY